MGNKEVAVKKKQRIRDSNKMMFIWVASVSAIVGVCGVVSWFLYQNLAFKTVVVNEKAKTSKYLSENNKKLDALRDSIRVLETNDSLLRLRANEDDKSLQVVLDALPSDANSLALGASLQKKLAADIAGLTIESLETQSVLSSSSSKDAGDKLPFKMTVSATDAGALKELLTRFEKSIRAINIEQLLLERSDTRYTMTIEGVAYYQQEKTTDLKTKVVKP